MNTNWVHTIPTPEAYWIDRVLYDTQHNAAEMERFRADSTAYLRGMPLSPDARRALVENNIGALYLAGANAYLLRAHCLGLNVPEAEYLAALRAVGDAASG